MSFIREIIKNYSTDELIKIVKDYDFLEENGWLGEISTLRDIVKEIKEESGIDSNFILMAHSVTTLALRELVKRSYNF
jgi:hypothetical protein